MYNKPLVSILLPVYNGEKYLKQALESLLHQTYEHQEILVLNDASTDNSMKIAGSFNDSRIKIFHNERNLGIVETLNKGIKLAKGTFTARMDADDISLPNRIERQVNYLLDHPEVALVDVIMEYIDEQGNSLKKYNSNIIKERDIRFALTYTNPIGHPSAMLRTAVYKKYFYRNIFEDYDLWLRLVNDNYRIHKIPEVLVYYRIHESSIMVNVKRKRRTFLALTKLNYYWGLNWKDKIKIYNLMVASTGIFNYVHAWIKSIITH